MKYSLEDYKARIAEIEKEAEDKKKAFMMEVANANNTYKKGDIVSDGTTTLQVEVIKVARGWANELPCCVYYGIELKKDSTPKIRQSGEGVYQRNIK